MTPVLTRRDPYGELTASRGSQLLPVAELAEFARRPARSTDTEDLSASLRSDGRWRGGGRVLNIGEGGMLIESGMLVESSAILKSRRRSALSSGGPTSATLASPRSRTDSKGQSACGS